jgi:phosphoglucosamine mutase
LDQHSTGDGTIAALQVLAAMSQNQKSLAELLEAVSIFPQGLLNGNFTPGYQWQSDEMLQQQISKVEANLQDSGRVLIRASGTEPVLRVMVETKDGDVAMKAAKSIADLVPVA